MTPLRNLLQPIIQSDYGWDNPKTLIVLVPGISLFVLKEKIHGFAKEMLFKDFPSFEKEYNRRFQLGSWHIRGAGVQAVALVILAIFTRGYSLALLPLPIYELWTFAKVIHKGDDGIEKGLTNGTFNGTVKLKSIWI